MYEGGVKMVNNVTHQKGLSLGLRCLLVLILVLAMAVFASNMVTYHQYSKIERESAAQREEYQQLIDMAEKYTNGSIDYESIVRIAREKFNLAFPDETIYYSGQGTQP